MFDSVVSIKKLNFIHFKLAYNNIALFGKVTNGLFIINSILAISHSYLSVVFYTSASVLPRPLGGGVKIVLNLN